MRVHFGRFYCIPLRRSAVSASIFIAQELLRMSGLTLVLSKLTEEDSDEPGEYITERVTLERRLWEVKSALEMSSSHCGIW